MGLADILKKYGTENFDNSKWFRLSEPKEPIQRSKSRRTQESCNLINIKELERNVEKKQYSSFSEEV